MYKIDGMGGGVQKSFTRTDPRFERYRCESDMLIFNLEITVP